MSDHYDGVSEPMSRAEKEAMRRDEADYDALAARLAEAERKIAGALRTAGGRWCEWGSRAESVRDILQGTTDSASGVQK